jgi:hypothetical protein
VIHKLNAKTDRIVFAHSANRPKHDLNECALGLGYPAPRYGAHKSPAQMQGFA